GARGLRRARDAGGDRNLSLRDRGQFRGRPGGPRHGRRPRLEIDGPGDVAGPDRSSPRLRALPPHSPQGPPPGIRVVRCRGGSLPDRPELQCADPVNPGTMEFEQFYLGCLAQASYLIGSDGEAAIVDPRRDVDVYIEAAKAKGL